MKIEFSVEADTAADLLKSLKNFVGDTGIGEDAGVKSPLKKVTAEEKTEKGKKDPEPKEERDQAVTTEDVRLAIIKLAEKLEWDPKPPKINAFTKAFAKKHDLFEGDGETVISRIPQIPAEKLKAFLEAIKEAGEI